ncbi:MAG: methylmalonyl-CoA mutase family protein, partial [Planctomycetota bacterium]
ATTLRRMLSHSDVTTNLLRLTIAAFSAGVGGADAVTVMSYAPDGRNLAARMSRNIQRLLIEESHLTDRLLAYHGEPDQVRYADCYIDSAKHGPWVFDGDAMMISSHLPQQEERTALKALNADKGILRQALLAAHDLDAEDPTAVAIDHLGCDIRARFGVTRIAFDEPITTADEAIEAIKDFAS